MLFCHYCIFPFSTSYNKPECATDRLQPQDFIVSLQWPQFIVSLHSLYEDASSQKCQRCYFLLFFLSEIQNIIQDTMTIHCMDKAKHPMWLILSFQHKVNSC